MILLNVKPNKNNLVLKPYLVRYNHQEQLCYNDGTTEKVRKAILNVTKKAPKYRQNDMNTQHVSTLIGDTLVKLQIYLQKETNVKN